MVARKMQVFRIRESKITFTKTIEVDTLSKVGKNA